MKEISIMLPDVPLVISPNREECATLFANGIPFKITGAERVVGIDYDAFVCPGMFIGSLGISAKPWPLAKMFAGFSWPGGQSHMSGVIIPFPGTVDFHFRVRNVTDRPQRFQIKLLGFEWR